MTSRERVLAALRHEETDRIPVDFGGHRSSGIAGIAYANLKKELGIETGGIYIYDMVQQLAIIEEPVLDALNIDVIEMGRGFLTDDADWKDWVLPDGTPCKIPYYVNVEKHGDDWFLYDKGGLELGVQTKGCLYFEQTHYPLANTNISDDDFSQLRTALAQNIWCGVPHPGAHLPLDKEGLAEMTRCAKKLRESTDRAILGIFGGNMLEIPQFLYGMENYLMYMSLYPEDVVRLSEALCAIHMENLEKWLGAVGPYIDIVLFGDDLGSQNTTLLSPEMYREYYKPYHEKLWKRTKELADVQTQLHSCGAISTLIGDLIEAGIDSINPVQINCDNMGAAELKDDFGKEVTFWGGGCDTGTILPNASPDEVAAHVRKQVNAFSGNGGFVFQQVHNILANVPAKNIVAMFGELKAGRFAPKSGQT